MSDQPLDESQKPTPSSGSDSPPPASGLPGDDWYSPEEAETSPPEAPVTPPAADAPAETPAASGLPGEDWYTPEDHVVPGWHMPEAQPPAASISLPRAADEEVILPGSWHSPPPVTDSSEIPAASPGAAASSGAGWYVPPGSLGEALLAGVDATVHPLPEAAQEPAPVDEETTAVAEAPAEEILIDDSESAPDAGTGDAVIGTEEERALYSDPAAMAAMMAAKYAEQAKAEEEEAPEEPGKPEEDEGPTEVLPVGPEDSFFPVGASQAAPPPVTPALERLAAQFDSVEVQVGTLRDMYHQGQISREALQAELRKLMILDEQGTWWMVGMESNTWYRFENGQWVEAERPRLPEGAATQPSIALDEYNMPVVQNVPHTDPQATLVGAAAIQFDDMGQPTLAGATVPAGQYTPPDYSGAYADAEESDVYRQAQAEQQHRVRDRVIKIVLAVAFSLLGIALVLIIGLVLYYVSVVNRYNDEIANLGNQAGQFQTVRIYDNRGQLIATLSDPSSGQRISVPLEQINPFMIHAVVSIEDERFYQNPGWDPIAVVRAVIQNLFAGEVVSGASTITQQLARMLVLEPERQTDISVGRKIDEIIIAAEIGRRYSKNDILELYLNEINLGNTAYGAEAGAETYFDISANALNLPQGALLAGIIACPASCNPVANRDVSFSRMGAVLNRQVEVGCLPFEHEPFASSGRPFCVTRQDVDAAVVQRAQVEVAEYSPPPTTLTNYPHYVNYVMQEMEQNYGLTDVFRAGYNIYTALDRPLQDLAQQTVQQQIASLQSQGIGGNNASVIVMDPRDGRITTMVGSADFSNTEIDGQVNVAFTAQQPGSAIKPILYAGALQGNAQGQYFTPATILWDTPTCWGNYCPTNYSGTFTGPLAVRSALAMSQNVPAVKTLEFLGTERYQQTAEVMGLTFPGVTPIQAGLPGALGAFDVRLYDMVVAYGTLANSGRRVTPHAIVRVLDNNGAEVSLPPLPQPQQVIQPEHAYLITSILSDNVARTPAFGANSPLNIPGYQVAAKTGTTNEDRDNWTVGYAPNVVVGVWHGNTDNSPMRGTTGLTGAAPIWNAVISSALSREAPQQFPPPSGVGTVTVCADSGTIPSALCLNRRQELVAIAQPPPGPEADIYQMVEVDTLTNLRANDFCPNFREQSLFLLISDTTAFPWINNTNAGRAWAQQRNIPLPAAPVPTESCNPNVQVPIIEIDWPTPSAQVEGLVEVRGRVMVYNFRDYTLEFGIGQNPAAFQAIAGPYNVQRPNSDVLGVWDVSQLPAGPYTLRLHINTNSGGFANRDNIVLVSNPLPTAIPTATVQLITQTPSIPTVVFPTITPPPGFTVEPPPIILPTDTPNVPPPLGPTNLPPWDINAAIPVVFGAEATGIISNAQYAVAYRFDGQAGDQVEITVDATAGDLDPAVYLLDSMGNVLSSDDDGGDGINSRLAVALPFGGTYGVIVTRFDVGAGYTTGEYRMRLNKLN